MVKRSQIIEKIEALERVVKDWENLDPNDPNTSASMYQGMRRRNFTSTIVDAANALFALVETQDIAEDARELVLIIDAWYPCLSEFLTEVDRGAMIDPSGGKAVWEPYHAILLGKRETEIRKPENIRQLEVGKVNPEQIAKIYQWYLEDDWYEMLRNRETPTPDIQKVAEESENPGTHYNPEEWMSRRDLDRIAEVNRKWEERGKSMQARKDQEKKAKTRGHCPERLEELIALDNMSHEQIIKMNPKELANLKTDEDKIAFIRQRAAYMDIPFDATTVAMAADPTLGLMESEQRAKDGQKQELRRAKIMAKYTDCEGTDDMIRAMLRGQETFQDIYAIVGRWQPNLTIERIEEIAENLPNEPAPKKRGRPRKAETANA